MIKRGIILCAIALMYNQKLVCSKGTFIRNRSNGCFNEKWGKLCPSIQKIDEIRQKAINRSEHVMNYLKYDYDNIKSRISNGIICMKQFNKHLIETQERVGKIARENMRIMKFCIFPFSRELPEEKNNMENIKIKMQNMDLKYKSIMNDLTELENIISIPTIMRSSSEFCKVNVLTGNNCSDIYNKGARHTGVYYITAGTNFPVPVLCDMDDDLGGWSVIQNRINGNISFDRSWSEYKFGFGDINCDHVGDYWLGNEYIHRLTRDEVVQMKIELTPWEGSMRYALYSFFRIGDEKSSYPLLNIDGYIADLREDVGNAFHGSELNCKNDPMARDDQIGGHKGMQFTTLDRDNDQNTDGNCAGDGAGGWWHRNCYSVNLNGVWYTPRNKNELAEHEINNFENPMLWEPWKGCWKTLKASKMKLRPLNYFPRTRPLRRKSEPSYYPDDSYPSRVLQHSVEFRTIRARRMLAAQRYTPLR